MRCLSAAAHQKHESLSAEHVCFGDDWQLRNGIVQRANGSEYWTFQRSGPIIHVLQLAASTGGELDSTGQAEVSGGVPRLVSWPR